MGKDIVKGRAPLHEPAKNFYGALSTRCASNCHVFDIFACSLDQLGVAEQRIMCDNTGGCLVLSDTFTRNSFPPSYSHITPQLMPSELDQNSTTIEYEQQQAEATQPAFLFVVDIAIPE